MEGKSPEDLTESLSLRREKQSFNDYCLIKCPNITAIDYLRQEYVRDRVSRLYDRDVTDGRVASWD
jgi:hypothetical protein